MKGLILFFTYFISTSGISQPSTQFFKDSTNAFLTDLSEYYSEDFYLQGVYYLQEKDYEKAITSFNITERQKSPPDKLYFVRGMVYRRKGNHIASIRDFIKDHFICPGRSSYNIAQSYALLNDYKSTQRWLDSAYKYNVRFSRKSVLTDTCFQKVKNNKAFRKGLKKYSFSLAEKYIIIAEKRFVEGDLQGALEYTQKALELEPEIPEWYQLKAHIRRSLNEFENARDAFFEEAQYRPFEKAEPYFDIANTYIAENELSKSIVWYMMAIKSDSSFYTKMIDVAELYILNNQYNKAMETLKEYLKKVPVDHYAWFLKAILNTDPENSQAEIERAIQTCRLQGKQVPQKYFEVQNIMSLRFSQ